MYYHSFDMERYTNVCEATSQSHDLDSYRPTHRKGKKLLAEKKRRARINNCLMQIRDIVCNGEESKDTDIDKMEKAEILEKTLEVLTKLRHDHDGTRGTLSSHKAMAVRYASGFSSCAEESIRYIQCSRLIPSEVKHQLQTHLRSIVRRIESSVHEPSMSYELPLPSLPAMSTTPVSSLSAINPDPTTSSLCLLLPVSNNTSSTSRVSPNVRLDFRDPSHISPPPVSGIKAEPSHPRVNIPSPILSSTPVLHAEHEVVTVTPMSQITHNSHSHFSPITAHDFSSEHKENHPKDMSYFCASTSTYCQEKKIFSSQGNSAFRQCTPSSASPKSEQHDLYYAHNSSLMNTISSASTPSSSSHPLSSSSSLPTASTNPPMSLPSQYSPISPATSPVQVHHSSMSIPPVSSTHSAALLQTQPMYHYHGYEPYPVLPSVMSAVSSPCVTTVLTEASAQPTTLNTSRSTPSIASNNNVLDLCTKRSDSHNISPETMWRPW